MTTKRKTKAAETATAKKETFAKTGAKVTRVLTKPSRPGVERRDLLVIADERAKFSNDLQWLFEHSVRCAVDGPQPLPSLGLRDIELGVRGCRLRVERSAARASTKRSREHHELLVLQSTLHAFAAQLQGWSKALKIRAGAETGRPLGMATIEGEYREALGIPPRKLVAPTLGRRRVVTLSDDDLRALVLKHRGNGKVTWKRAAELAATDYLMATGALTPNAATWRVDAVVPPVASNIEKRMATLNTQTRKLAKNPPD